MRNFRILITLLFALAGCLTPTTAMLLSGRSENETESSRRQLCEEISAVCGEQSHEQRKRNHQGTLFAYQVANHAPRAKATRATANLSYLPGCEHAGRNGLGTALLN